MNDTTLSYFGFTPRHIKVAPTAQRVVCFINYTLASEDPADWQGCTLETLGNEKTGLWNVLPVLLLSWYLPNQQFLFHSQDREFVSLWKVSKECKLPIALKALKQGKPVYSSNTSCSCIKRLANLKVCVLQPHLEEPCFSNFNLTLWGVHYVQF